eukprot:TRINITY_DN10666_c0_g1_i1.p4 TRINITY_DN10666_c0_g1~~TRINITY_DN10666_c0_g1_i1.p4  ORF type:complete len:119 (+),score=6.86 TRINITY_DN10666_c0_g1_i1:2557-2913(+)
MVDRAACNQVRQIIPVLLFLRIWLPTCPMLHFFRTLRRSFDIVLLSVLLLNEAVHLIDLALIFTDSCTHIMVSRNASLKGGTYRIRLARYVLLTLLAVWCYVETGTASTWHHLHTIAI